MNALEVNRFTDAWRAFGAGIPRPRAVLAISAHWYVNASAVTAMAQPRTIHDFYGFPDELFAFEYPAPGDPGLAAEVVDLVEPTWIGVDTDSWGLDHGTWSVLAHVFPDAGVPVVQLSINAMKPFEYHFELGAKLAPLRERGVLVACSGNVVHNLGRLDWANPDSASDWAQRFDDDITAIMTDDPAGLVGAASHRDYRLAAPTPDHFLPLVYLAGMAAAAGARTEVLAGGCSMGSLSMTSYTLGWDGAGAAGGRGDPGGAGAAPVLPDVPADETNV